MEILSLEQLKQIKVTDVIEMTDFKEEGTVKVEVKKPSMMALVASGKIPNPLMEIALGMMNGKGVEVSKNATKSAKNIKEMSDFMKLMASECLVSPTYEQIQEYGLELNEAQFMEILLYSQGGVKALENFRKQHEFDKDTESNN